MLPLLITSLLLLPPHSGQYGTSVDGGELALIELLRAISWKDKDRQEEVISRGEDVTPRGLCAVCGPGPDYGLPAFKTQLEATQYAVGEHRHEIELIRRAIPLLSVTKVDINAEERLQNRVAVQQAIRLLALDATLAVSEGRPSPAASDIVLTFDLAANYIACLSDDLNIFNHVDLWSMLPKLGPHELQLLESRAERALAQWSDYGAVVQRASQRDLDRWSDRNVVARKVIEDYLWNAGESSQEHPGFQSLTPQVAERIRTSMCDFISRSAAEWHDILRDDEQQWRSRTMGLHDATGDSFYSENAKIRTLRDLEAALKTMHSSEYKYLVETFAEVRTKCRLLILECRIYQYLLSHHRLPTKLSNVADDRELENPITGAPVVYERENDRHFRLYTAGFSEVRRINPKWNWWMDEPAP